jgi:hypothetical protein
MDQAYRIVKSNRDLETLPSIDSQLIVYRKLGFKHLAFDTSEIIALYKKMAFKELICPSVCLSALFFRYRHDNNTKRCAQGNNSGYLKMASSSFTSAEHSSIID